MSGRGALVGVPRCYVVVQSYQQFVRFCVGNKVRPKDQDIVCIYTGHDWRRLLERVDRKNSFFVFLAEWDKLVSEEVRDEMLGVINSITMSQSPPYRRCLYENC